MSARSAACFIAVVVAGAWTVMAQTEMGVEGSLMVKGTGGTKSDPNLKVWGYTGFGTNWAGAVSVTSGVGNVYIQNSLEVGSNFYLRGTGLVFPDSTTQTTAYVTPSPVSTMVSGECDTNRLDILFGTNYVVTGVKVWQTPTISQTMLVYSNGTVVDTFAFATSTELRNLSFGLNPFDRLGIACTNINGTVLFSFEGRRP